MGEFLWISEQDWKVWSYAANCVLAITAVFLPFLNTKIRRWFNKNIVQKAFSFTLSIPSRLKNTTLSYRDQVLFSEYYIDPKDSELVKFALLKYAYLENLSEKKILGIEKNPIKSLGSIGVKVSKQEDGKLLVCRFNKNFGFVSNRDNHLELLRTINGLSNSHDYITLIPITYIMRLFPYKKKKYIRHLRSVVGTIGRTGDKTFHHIMKMRWDIGAEERYPYIDIDFIKKEVQLLWISSQARKRVDRRKTNSFKFNVYKERQGYINVSSDKIGRVGPFLDIDINKVGHSRKAKEINDVEQELFDSVFENLWSQLTRGQRKRHKLNNKVPFEKDLNEIMYKYFTKKEKGVPVEVWVNNDPYPIEGGILKEDLGDIIKNGYADTSSICVRVPDGRKMIRKIYVNPSIVVSVNPKISEENWI